MCDQGFLGDGETCSSEVAIAVAWPDETSGASEIYLRQWNGSSWAELGGSASGVGLSSTAGGAAGPKVALDSDGHPVVAWYERPTGVEPRIYLKRWNGSTWDELDGSASGSGVGLPGSTDPSLAIDSSDRIIVVWMWNDPDASFYVHGRRWDGSAWQELDGSATGGGIGEDPGFHPDVAVDSLDRPVVAYQANSDEVYLKRWNGSTWEELDGSASGGGLSDSGASTPPTVAIGQDDNPAVAWAVLGGSGEVLGFAARRFDGSAWLALETEPTAVVGGTGPTFPVGVDKQDRPVVLQFDYRTVAPVEAFRWNGTTWESLPGLGSTSRRPGLATHATGAIIAAWSESAGAGNSEIYLRHFNGSTWNELGGSATTGGISNTAGHAFAPSVAAH